MSDSSTARVLVTGGSGFIGAHLLVATIQKGYRVRTTVRSLAKAEQVREKLVNGGISAEKAKEVEIVEADLLQDKGWDEAVAGCAFVHHVASPYPLELPKTEEETVKPAREGTMRVLDACLKAGSVKRVVLTSSIAAMAYGHGDKKLPNPTVNYGKVYTEDDWTLLDDKAKSFVGPYPKSKTLAERDAWQWYESKGKAAGIDLVSVNPVCVWGPSLAYEENTSLSMAAQMLNGQLPGLPNLLICVVDVRDVADLHLLAMEAPNAAGQRYIATADDRCVSARGIADLLKANLPADQTTRIPSYSIPDWLIRFMALFDAGAANITGELSLLRASTSAKAKAELGWKPRPAKEAIVSGAQSLKRTGRFKSSA